MNNWCNCWFSRIFLLEILNLKGSLRDVFISRSALNGQFGRLRVKYDSQTCFGTYVPYSGIPLRHLLKFKCYREAVIYMSPGL
jgi:hypothetical protein